MLYNYKREGMIEGEKKVLTIYLKNCQKGIMTMTSMVKMRKQMIDTLSDLMSTKLILFRWFRKYFLKISWTIQFLNILIIL